MVSNEILTKNKNIQMWAVFMSKTKLCEVNIMRLFLTKTKQKKKVQVGVLNSISQFYE